MHTLIFFATTDPTISSENGLRPGLTEDQITPGLLGFVITFSIVVVMFFLIRDMTKRIRRVRYREQIEVSRSGGSHGPAADHMGIPLMTDAEMKAAGNLYDDVRTVPAGAPVAAVAAETDDSATEQK